MAAGSSIRPGTYAFGPANSTLSVRTSRTGAAAKAGHNLLIDVTAWQATLELSEDRTEGTIALAVDATSLRVREGTGGIQELGNDDIAEIQETIAKEILQQRAIEFRSTDVRSNADGSRLTVEGELTLVGESRPIAFDLAVDDGDKLSGRVILKQTDWGIKPYSTLFGALKVVDEVEVNVEAGLDS